MKSRKGAYEAMWCVTMFDLPVADKDDRHAYTRFHKFLIQEGFMRLQFSVYAYYCADQMRANKIIGHIKNNLPPNGQIRIMLITDIQFGRQSVFVGYSRVKTEQEPEQLLLF